MRGISITVLVATAVLIGTPRLASAQVDLTGIWAPIFHEDQLERAPGPEVGDYSGLPITVRALAYVMAGHVRHHLAILCDRYGVA